MTDVTEELEINEDNFDQYFKDVRKNNPERGEIIAQYSASAELIDGNEKRQIISLLISTENKMEATAQVMRKLLCASELDAYRVPRMMAEDLLSGMDEGEVASKPYKYTFEMFFYTKPEYVPDDPHWTKISVLNLKEFLDKKEQATDSSENQHENNVSELGQDETHGNAGDMQVSKAE